MDLRPNSDEARDIAYHFHSYTNARLHEQNGPLIMDRGEGVHVFDTHGNKYIEGMSGLWSVAVGFNEQRLIDAATRQMQKLPYNHKSFDLPLPGILHTTCPHYWREGQEGESEEQFATRCAEDLDAMIQAEGPDTIAAFIAEPVMGAGGVVVPPKTYWEKIQAVLGKYDILLIADEVICGFGRTGKMFGCETFGIKPDIMTMSKQITSSYFPFSAFMMTEEVYAPIADESGRIGVLGHGYTGGAHPVGAAVALENLKIIEERDLVANAAERGAELQAGLRTFVDHPLVGEARGVGLIAALEIVAPEGRAEEFAPGKMGAGLNAHFLKNGLISRNMMDAMAFCPPMIIQSAQISEILAAVEKSLDGFETELNTTVAYVASGS